MSSYKGGSQKTQKEGNFFAISGGEDSAPDIIPCLGWPPFSLALCLLLALHLELQGQESGVPLAPRASWQRTSS